MQYIRYVLVDFKYIKYFVKLYNCVIVTHVGIFNNMGNFVTPIMLVLLTELSICKGQVSLGQSAVGCCWGGGIMQFGCRNVRFCSS